MRRVHVEAMPGSPVQIATRTQPTRYLILCYDSKPTERLLWPFVSQLATDGECLFLVQFPSTAKALRARGHRARLVRSILGWEHGELKPSPLKSPKPLIPLTDSITYESRLTGGMHDGELLAQANVITHAFRALLDQWQPHLVLAWNGHTLPYKPCIAYARKLGIPVRVLERGFFSQSLYVDYLGTNFASSARTMVHAELGDVDTQGRKVAQATRDSYEPIVGQGQHNWQSTDTLRRHLSLLPETFLFLLPEQLDHDSNTVLFCDNPKTNLALISAVDEALRVLGEKGARILVKPHPESHRELCSTTLEQFKSVVTVSHVPLEVLLRETNAVITRNSTIGLEGLLFGKPCITLGDSIYSGLGITEDVRNPSCLAATLLKVMHTRELSQNQLTSLHRLIGLLHSRYHYFTGSNASQQAANRSLLSRLRADAMDYEPNSKGFIDNWNLSWRQRFEEWRWGWRLKLRHWRATYLRGLL